MQEKVINIVQETLRSGTFEGMGAILDDVDMTVVLPMLLRLFCFLRLLRFFWKEKWLLLFFCKGLKIEWLNLTGIDAGRQNLTELDPKLALGPSNSLLLNIIELYTMLLVVFMVFMEDIFNSEKRITKEMIDALFWGLGSSRCQNEWLNFTDNEQEEEDTSFTNAQRNNGQVEKDTSFTNAQRDNGQVEEDTSFTNPQRENGQVEEEDTSFTNAQKDNGQVEEDTSFINAQRVFKIETLVTATDNFHYNNKLGKGGFGTVYKGTTHDGKQIAVKKLLSPSSDRRKKEFLNEKLLAKIQHRNIVNLLGCCEEGSQMFVVYEYLPNGSLHKFLSDAEKRKDLDWQKRYNIILGIARALLYLHEDSQLRIVHRDIKASNILLDEKLNPKIADFGTAKLFPEDETHVNTLVVGTPEYMAPEYAMGEQLSVNADVYSFGILLLELVTGKKISSEMDFLGRIWSSYKQGKSVRTIDQAIIETCHKKQALRCIHIGLLCTQDNALLRPPMSEVTVMLSTPSVALPVPTEPPLYDEIHERGCCFFR